MDDPMKEFKEIYTAICNPKGESPDLKWLSLANIASALNKAICNYEKSHTEQNRPTTIDFGELLPLECGFGDE